MTVLSPTNVRTSIPITRDLKNVAETDAKLPHVQGKQGNEATSSRGKFVLNFTLLLLLGGMLAPETRLSFCKQDSDRGPGRTYSSPLPIFIGRIQTYALSFTVQRVLVVNI